MMSERLAKYSARTLTIDKADDSSISQSSCSELVSMLSIADEALIKHVDIKSNAFLLALGMLFTYNSYAKTSGRFPIPIQLATHVEPTPGKSYNNVLLAMQAGNVMQLEPYEIRATKAFMISPVRVAGPETEVELKALAKQIINEGTISKVHIPLLDTKQDEDNIGTRISRDNLHEQANSGTTLMRYLFGSTGSVVDTGSFLMLKYFLDNLHRQRSRSFRLLNRAELDPNSPYCALLSDLDKETDGLR